MNELVAQSESRNGAVVLWITLHTAEGPTDAFPTAHDRDAGSAQSLLEFFEGKTDRSCHAIADDDVILDGLVPYDRAAWTLRGGNHYSDNLEMCGLAAWTRSEWLQHLPMLTIAARWVVDRCRARGISPRLLSIEQVAARQLRGYIDHNRYTQATHDGTHWDCGPYFPWDVLAALIEQINGEDEDVPTLDEIGGEVTRRLGTFKVQHLDGTLNRVKSMEDEELPAIRAELAELRQLVTGQQSA